MYIHHLLDLIDFAITNVLVADKSCLLLKPKVPEADFS